MFSNRLKAVSIGQLALDCLNGDIKKGLVHSVFRRVINIAWPDERLSSISRLDVSNGPANIVTSLTTETGFAIYGIQPGNLVWLDTDQYILHVGTIALALDQATLWISPLADFSSSLHPALIMTNFKVIRHWYEHSSTESPGLAPLIFHLDELLNGSYVPANDSEPLFILGGHSINRLLPALRRNDKTGIRESVLSLVGLGPGLTPSGDDYLAGLMLALAGAAKLCPETFLTIRNTLSNVLLTLPSGLTNDLSHQMLIHAAKGTGSERMEKMVLTLFCATPDDPTLLQAATALSAIGASSGYDQLLGILSGIFLTYGSLPDII